jgi:hypothetical protein
VQPSKRRAPAKKTAATKKSSGKRAKAAPKSTRAARTATETKKTTTGRRVSKHPLIEIGRAKKKSDVLAGLERWRSRHPDAAAHLEPADVLVDAMRGRYSTWTRIRVNLQHVPEDLRPSQEPLDPDDEPSWKG